MTTKQMRRCKTCGRYSLKEKCASCGNETESAHPAKFSIADKFAKWRRQTIYG